MIGLILGFGFLSIAALLLCVKIVGFVFLSVAVLLLYVKIVLDRPIAHNGIGGKV